MSDPKRVGIRNVEGPGDGRSPRKEGVVRRIGIVMALAVVALAGCAPKPEDVTQQLIEAVNAQDVDGALALFAEGAVVDTSGPAPFTGKAEIRGWLEELSSVNFEIEAEIVEVRGDTVVEKERMTMDPWNAIGLRSLEGVSEITVQEGLIQSLDFEFSEVSLQALQTATLKATQPTHSNLAYVEGGSPEQVLDIYLPAEGDGPFPTILMIHGGGDEKEDHNGMAGFFGQAGFATVLIDYGDTYRQTADGLCALAWTRANAGEYGLDPNRITVFGFSIGGLVASSMATTDDRAAELQGCGHPLPVTGGMLGVAIYEGVLVTPEGCLSASWCLSGASADTGIPLVELQPIFETLREVPPAQWRDVEAVGAEAEALARLWPLYWLDGSEPPFLVIHGSGDLIPRIESEAFATHLQDSGIEVELLLLPNASHQSVYPASASFPEIAGAVVEFASELASD